MRKISASFAFTITVLTFLFISTSTQAQANPCFNGTTFVNGVPTAGVEVYLTIGDSHYGPIYSNFDGYYEIGDAGDSGRYLLWAVYGTVDPPLKDSQRGVKTVDGTVTINLNCH
jgi:hypothetical protein